MSDCCTTHPVALHEGSDHFARCKVIKLFQVANSSTLSIVVELSMVLDVVTVVLFA